MIISIGTDHRGKLLKEELLKELNDLNFIDKSPINTDTDDYPDFAYKVAKSINSKESDLGVLICGTGIGISIAANKCKGIRCALVHSVEDAKLAKLHNDANAIAFGANTDLNLAKDMVLAFINTKHIPDSKHDRRVNKVMQIESGEYNEL